MVFGHMQMFARACSSAHMQIHECVYNKLKERPADAIIQTTPWSGNELTSLFSQCQQTLPHRWINADTHSPTSTPRPVVKHAGWINHQDQRNGITSHLISSASFCKRFSTSDFLWHSSWLSWCCGQEKKSSQCFQNKPLPLAYCGKQNLNFWS